MKGRRLNSGEPTGSKGKRINSKDVAQLLDFSPDDAVHRVLKGMLKATMDGSVWTYHPASVRAYRRRIKLSD